MTTHEILVAARKLIEKPENWTQGHYREGDKFCVLGALMSSCEPGIDSKYVLAKKAVANVVRETEQISLVEFNDNHTHEEVIALLDRAIAATKEGN